MGHRNKQRHAAAIACLNCGQSLTGGCAACGQAPDQGREPSLGHFARDLVHEVFRVDGKQGQRSPF